MSITAAFERYGEEGFRGREAEVVGSLLEEADGGAIALGGGSVLSPRVREALPRHMSSGCRSIPARPGDGSPTPIGRWRAAPRTSHACSPSARRSTKSWPTWSCRWATGALSPGPCPRSRRSPSYLAARGCCGRAAPRGEYPVLVGRGLLGCPLVAASSRRFCVTDPSVGAALRRAPCAAGGQGRDRTRRALKDHGRRREGAAGAGPAEMTREDHVVALGGGVVGDLGGFCAHLYQRGVPVVQVPTTLVAQVDSAYGGKAGVDLPEGKNYAGAFQLPAAVIADTEALETLSRGELAAGFVEVLKTGLLAGGSLWERVRGSRRTRPGRARRRRLCLRPLQVRGRRRRRARHRPAQRAQPRPHGRPRDRVGDRLHALPPRRGGRPGTAGRASPLRRRGAARRGRGDPRSSSCRPRSTPELDIETVLDALERDKKRTAAGVGFVLLSEPGEPRSASWSTPLRS